MSKRWTEGELDYLEKNYGKINAIEISKKLNRSPHSVRHKAKRIGLAEKRNYWDEDDEIYLEYFAFEGDTKLTEAANFLNRSSNSVQIHLSKMRRDSKNEDLYLSRPWLDKEDAYLRKNDKVMTRELIARRLNRSAKSIEYRAKVLGLKKYTDFNDYDLKIRELAQAGKVPVDIARELRLNADSLRIYLKSKDIDHNVLSTEESLERAREKSPWKRMEQARYAEYLSKKRKEGAK